MKPHNDRRYSRGSILPGGLLVDVSDEANEVGLEYPVALTAGLARLLRPNEYLEKLGVSFEGRTKLLLTIVRQELKPHEGPSDIRCDDEKHLVNMPLTKGPLIREEIISVIALVHDGDDGEPVITLFPPEPNNEAA
jgi:hypothetical protein